MVVAFDLRDRFTYTLPIPSVHIVHTLLAMVKSG